MVDGDGGAAKAGGGAGDGGVGGTDATARGVAGGDRDAPTGGGSGGKGDGASAAAGGRGKKGGKSFKQCVGSSFTWGSMRQTLLDVVRLAGVKGKLWARVLAACGAVLKGAGESSSLTEEGTALLEELIDAVKTVARLAASVRSKADVYSGQLEESCKQRYGVSWEGRGGAGGRKDEPRYFYAWVRGGRRRKQKYN